MPDHDALFRNLAAVLRPGGRLVAQCGGVGNIASIQRVLADDRRRLARATSISRRRSTTVRRLDAAGFVDIECWLTDEPTRFEPGEPFEAYLRTVVLGSHLERLPASEHDAFVRAVADGLPRAGDRLRPAQHRCPTVSPADMTRPGGELRPARVMAREGR